MPFYEFKCGGCGKKMTVVRRMSDCDLPPDSACCAGTEWKKVFSLIQRPAHDSSRDPFPMKMKTPNGESVVFQSATHQREYMSRNGFSLNADWHDSTMGGKHHFDKQESDNSAPTERAAKLAENAEYVSEQEAQSSL